MKKIAILSVFLSLILSCSSTEPEEYFPMEGSEDKIYSFAIHNNYLYTSAVSKLNIYSLNDPENPTKIKEMETYGSRKLRIIGDDLYLPESATKIYSLSSTPENPSYKNYIPITECDLLAADNTYAFTISKGNSICTPSLKNDHLAVFDVLGTNSSIPVQHGQTDHTEAIALFGNYLFSAGKTTITVYSVADPVNIHSVKTIDNISAKQLIFQNNMLFAFTDSEMKQFSIDPNNIQNITLVNSSPL